MEFFSQISVFYPQIVLVGAALLVLAADALCPKAKQAGFVIALVGLLGSMCVSQFFSGGVGSIAGSVELIFSLCAILAILLTKTVAARVEFQAPITTHLFLIATASAQAIFKVSDFISFFVFLETLTVSLYALVGSYRKSSYSLEAGVKYLIAGGVSGGLMLFGIVLLYGAVSLASYAAPLSYESVKDFLANYPESPLGLAGVAMILAGILFKLGVFPMQFWIPDVYQGAPLHVTFFLATLSKGVGFFLALAMITGPFDGVMGVFLPILLGLTLISMVYGNVVALGQQKVKRLLGLSGVSHAAYLMLGLLAAYVAACNVPGSYETSFLVLTLYFVFYVLSLYPIFSAMAYVPARDEALQDIDDFRGLAKSSPVLAGALTAGLASLAGIPPTVGFVAKLAVLLVVFWAGYYLPAFVMLGCVVASVYYYFSWIRAVYSSAKEGESCEASICPNLVARITLIFFTVLTILGCIVYAVVFMNTRI